MLGQLPNLTDYDSHVYIHQFGDRLGTGNYDHEGLVVDVCAATDPGYGGAIARRYTGIGADLPFTEQHWIRARASLARLIPATAAAPEESSFNGLMTYAADGFPVIGPVPHIPGYWYVRRGPRGSMLTPTRAATAHAARSSPYRWPWGAYGLKEPLHPFPISFLWGLGVGG